MPVSLPAPSSRRPLSCGIVVVAPGPELLLCHVTGQSRWDLPKGGIHDGETPCDAARRETAEECGLVFAPGQLIDLGRVGYTPKKDLHLYAAASPRVEGLVCTSMFVERGTKRRRPEMDGFGWFAPGRVAELCSPRMAAVLGALDWNDLVARLQALDAPDREPLAA